MNGRVGVGAHTSANVSAHVSLTADVAVLAEAVADASVSSLVSILNQMLVAGEVRLEDEPEMEDVSDADEECSELDYGDEDVPEERDAASDALAERNPFRHDVIEIRVRQVGGDWLCDIPQSGWEGVVGVERHGKKAVKTVSARMQAYSCIAQLLERDHREILAKGPHAIRGPICSQRQLIDSGCFNDIEGFAKTKDQGASSLSRYLRSVDLVWDWGSIPLRKLFAE